MMLRHNGYHVACRYIFSFWKHGRFCVRLSSELYSLWNQAFVTYHRKDSGSSPHHQGSVDTSGVHQHPRGGDENAGSDDAAHNHRDSVHQAHLGLESHLVLILGLFPHGVVLVRPHPRDRVFWKTSRRNPTRQCQIATTPRALRGEPPTRGCWAWIDIWTIFTDAPTEKPCVYAIIWQFDATTQTRRGYYLQPSFLLLLTWLHGELTNLFLLTRLSQFTSRYQYPTYQMRFQTLLTESTTLPRCQ